MKHPIMLSPSFYRGMAALFALSVPALLSAQSYTALCLDSGLGSTAYNINNSGTVVGSVVLEETYWTITYTDNFAFDSVNGRPSGLFDINSCTYGINDSGTSVGGAMIQFGIKPNEFRQVVFSSTGGTMTNLDIDGLGRDINDAGTIVGYTRTGFDPATDHAFSYSGGVLTDLGVPTGGTSSRALAINSAGTIVGSWENDYLAFIYSGGVMTDLSTLNGMPGAAYDINDAGTVVGGWIDPFIYSGGVFTHLVSLGFGPSGAYGINNGGAVVGYYTIDMAISEDTRAFISNGVGMTDLSTLVTLPSGVYLTEARAINDYGQIAANGSDGHAYLLTPVPEPSTWAALCGLAALGFAAARRRKD